MIDQFAETHILGNPTIALNGTTAIANPVPWVVDFTSPPVYNNGITETQNPVPRPFYCTLYRESVNQDTPDYFSAHDWQFYAMPNQVEASTSTGILHQLYVDPNWQW
jgi:hypothetical protein